MKLTNSLLALALLSSVNVGAGEDCTCIGPANSKEALELSDAVFSGMVMKADELKAEVEAERVWKGNLTRARVIVLNPAPNAPCSITLARGRRYIVFASVDKERGRVSYIPKICFPTSALSEAGPTLKEIGEGRLLEKRRRLVKE